MNMLKQKIRSDECQIIFIGFFDQQEILDHKVLTSKSAVMVLVKDLKFTDNFYPLTRTF